MQRILFVVYEGFELLDLAGPSAVFANSGAPYEVACVSEHGGRVTSHSGIDVRTRRLPTPKARDTVLVMGAGAPALRVALRSKGLRRYLRSAATVAERVGSVCSGAFLLARAKLLDGKRAATHWEGCDPFRRNFPRVKLEPDALYVVDGKLWTSAGVTTGVDMALAMLRRDHGVRVMGRVARHLVVYAHRPGGQSQWSALLDGQLAASGEFSTLLDQVEGALEARTTVASLAQKAGMSVRTFHRKFTRATGVTPAKYVESLRLERAKRLLEASESVKAVARMVGFASIAAFRTRFKARFGLSPSAHRLMHRA